MIEFAIRSSVNETRSTGSSFLAMMSLRVGFWGTISKRWELVKSFEFININFKKMQIKKIMAGINEMVNLIERPR